MLKIEVIKIGPIENNVFLVYDTILMRGILIDCSDDSQKIIDKIGEKGVRIDYICLTHTHYDHVLGVKNVLKYLKKQGDNTNIKVVVHKNEKEFLLEGKLNPDYYSKTVTDKIDAEDLLIVKGGEKLLVGVGASGHDVDVEDGAAGGDNANVFDVDVMHTPGHTPGGICFLVNNSHLFCGDLIFKNGLGRTDLPGGNEKKLEESVANVKKMDKKIKLYPGHEDYGFTVEDRFY